IPLLGSLALALNAIVFAADLLLPADVEVGYGYLLAIVLASRGTSQRTIWFIAWVSLALMVLGVLIDPIPPTGAPWVPVVNRAIAIVSALVLARLADRRLRSEQRQRLLTRELSHRVKNALAVAQAFAVHSFSRLSKPAVEEFSMRL